MDLHHYAGLPDGKTMVNRLFSARVRDPSREIALTPLKTRNPDIRDINSLRQTLFCLVVQHVCLPQWLYSHNSKGRGRKGAERASACV